MVNFFIGLLIFYTLAHAETRQRVVVLDTGISERQALQPYMCENGVLSMLTDEGFDDHGHGTNIIGLITQNMNHNKYCIVSIKVFSKNFSNGMDGLLRVIRGLRKALDLNPAYVNLSLSGPDADDTESSYIKQLINNGSTIIVAAGNNSTRLRSFSCRYFPSCYKLSMTERMKNKFIVIGATGFSSSNYGEIVDHYLAGYKVGTPAMSGTSQATAKFTAGLVSR